MRCFSAILAIAATLVLDPCAAAAQDADSFVGKPLADALHALQGKGLQIVFTSVTVRPELRVQVEPRSRTARGMLDELLAPHGLEAQEGPNGVIQVVRAARATGPSRAYPPDPPAAIEGRVVHVFTRAPVENAIVEAPGAAAAVRTDATGGFALRPVTPGAWVIRVSIDGFAPLSKVIRVSRAKTVNVTLRLAPLGTTHSEEIVVTSATPYWPSRGKGTETSMTRGTFAQASGGLVDDPVRAVQTLPRVSLPDDFRSDFIVRGSPFRHVEIVIDGVATPWLQHTAYGRGTSGSLTMLTSHVVNDATLRVGAYAHRSGDRLGAELDMTIREGSRERFELRGAVSGTSATIIGEGPLGGSEQGAQGSWLVAARNSFLEWPSAKGGATRTPFGFSDGIAKLVYDVRPTQRIGFSVLGGTSNVDDDETQGTGELAGGTNRTTVANIFWRSSFGSSIVLTQRAYVVKHHFLSAPEFGQASVGGGNEEVAYRADVARPLFGGLIEAGGRIGRSTADDGAKAVSGGSSEQFVWQRSGYVNFAWAITPSLTVSPGFRITDSTLLPYSTFTRWIVGEYEFRPRWTMSASIGVSYQAPGLYQVRGRPAELPELRPERARHLDVGVAHQLARSVSWQVTAFDRKERDILREPDLYPRLAADARLDPGPRLYTNGLLGSSRGVELLVTRKSATGFSGWGSYSFGKTKQTDIGRSETFWADFDQRHLVNLFGVYRVSSRTSLGATARAASGFPIPGYLDSRDGTLVVGSRRNEVRLPAYARLDVRASRTFETFGRRLTAFGEIANVLDRANVGLARGAIDRATGEAVRFTTPMLRRRASLGILIEF